jgi:hypothetical protein
LRRPQPAAAEVEEAEVIEATPVSAPAFGGVFESLVTMSDVRELKTPPAPALDVAPSVTVDEDSIVDLARAGTPDSEIAVRLNTTLGRVLELKRIHGLDSGKSTAKALVTKAVAQVRTTTTVTQTAAAQVSESGEAPSAKDLITARISDFQNALDMALQEYMSDPGSETNHAAMVGFMKTLKDMLKSLKELDDPTDIASNVVRNVIGPFMKNSTVHMVESSRKIMEDLTPTMTNDYQREQMRECLNDALRLHRDKLRNEYNRAVRTLEIVYSVKLDTLMIRPEPAAGVDMLGAAPE